MSVQQIAGSSIKTIAGRPIQEWTSRNEKPGDTCVCVRAVFSVWSLWRVTCIAQNMILLITSLAKGQDCANALQEAAAEPTQVAATLRVAISQLQANEFSAVVIDQLLLDAESDGVDTVLKHMGMAVPVFSNFAISGIDRVSREL